jgi:hypothetical protein
MKPKGCLNRSIAAEYHGQHRELYVIHNICECLRNFCHRGIGLSQNCVGIIRISTNSKWYNLPHELQAAKYVMSSHIHLSSAAYRQIYEIIFVLYPR